MIILANHPTARADGDAYELLCVCGSRAGALDIDGYGPSTIGGMFACPARA